eukprot:Pgem_evm2s8255
MFGDGKKHGHNDNKNKYPNHKPDWDCSGCGISNFAKRTDCRRCGKDKEGSADAKGKEDAARDRRADAKLERLRQKRDGMGEEEEEVNPERNEDDNDNDNEDEEIVKESVNFETSGALVQETNTYK